nr:ATP-binding cassette domain-containing protein [Alloscardovia theropitheci]
MSNPSIVTFRDVMFRRQRRTIIADVNIDIKQGEKWIIFGPNGIGKSTMISMMATRLFPSSGTVDILGNRLGKVNVFSYRQKIGLASNSLNRAFDPLEDPQDAIVSAVNGHVGNWHNEYTQEQYRKARELMSRYDIEYLAGKQMYKLSEGERTRVGICRALMADPELLILDEPTTGLDLGGRELVVDALHEFARLDDAQNSSVSQTAVLVTHRLEEIPQSFTHIAILGRLDDQRTAQINAEIGKPEQMSADGYETFNPNPGSIIFTGSLEEGLTDERLSSLFDMDLHVVHENNRWAAFAR